MAQSDKATALPRVDARPETDRTSREARLDAVVARVRQDAKRDPKPYLRSTEVPGGGE